MRSDWLKMISLGSILLQCSGCAHQGLLATVGPDYHTEPLKAAAQWYAPQPDIAPRAHDGNQTKLLHWWAGFNDLILTRLLTAAEQQSPTLADARLHIEQARAGLVGALADSLPGLDGELAVRSSSASFGNQPFRWNQYSVGLQSNWEIDLFGGLARQKQASLSQLEAKNAAWHDARVSVAAETANVYLAYRYCQSQVQIVRADSESRQESARLSEIAGENGLRAPGDVALAKASAAESRSNLLKQQAQCEHTLKSLTAMTALDEKELRHLLDGSTDKIARLPEPPTFAIDAIPATVLMQRPDIAAAERQVAQASADIGVQRAKQFPRLSLSGNITPTLQNINGGAILLAQTWAIGPTLSLPLFDAGKRAADVAVAKQNYLTAVSHFRDKVRTAVKEVEDALVRLENVSLRLPQHRMAVEGFSANFLAIQTLYQNGLGNLIDVETARRNLLSAELTIKSLEQERISAWIALYRSVGGGWSPSIESTAVLNPLYTNGNHSITASAFSTP